MSDITEIKRTLAERARDVAEYLLPRGVLHGREWCVGSINGEAGESLKVSTGGGKAGTWADFAANGESGDLIDLWCLVKHATLVEAMPQIRDWLGIASPRFDKAAKTYRRPNKPHCTTPRSAVYDYLTGERKLQLDAIRAYRIGEDHRTIIFPSLLPEDLTLAFVKYLNIDRSPEGKKVTRVEAGCEPVLFGWQAIDSNAREITLTEGEIDAMTCWSYGMPALSVPFGGGGGAKQRWIESEFERMARFEVIYLALDMDHEGDIAAAEIADRLGRHRCRRVKLPRKDANECLKGGVTQAEFMLCFQQADVLDPPELVRPSAFTDAVIQLFWPVEGKRPGYQMPFHKVADRLFFRPGELTEWTGTTGVGKSQLLSYALLGMAADGARICAASLEMSAAQLIRRLIKQAGNTERPTELYAREVIHWLDQWLWMFGVVGKCPIERIISVFEYARCRYGCDVFVIDSLMRLGVSSEDYEGQEKAIFEIVNWAVEKNVHVHLVAHARKGDRSTGSTVPDADDIKGPSEIGNNAANIIGIWRNRKQEDKLRELGEAAERGDEGAKLSLEELREKPMVLVNVAKQRNGDWEGKFGLWFSTETYQYRSSHDSKSGRIFVQMEPVPMQAAE